MSTFTRRILLGRGLAGAGAVAIPGSLIAAATATAQDDSAETDALELLVKYEQSAELAYSLAAEEGDLDPKTVALFETFSLHSEDRATAFSEALDQLLVEAPESSSDPDDYENLEGFDPAGSENELLAFMIELELEIITAYEEDEPELTEPDLVRSAAQMAAAHAQALVALRLLAGEKGDVAQLPEASTSATDSENDQTDSG